MAEEPSIHADDGGLVWMESPKGEQVYLPKGDYPVFETEIPTNYIQVKCVGCTHTFWTWLNRSDVVHCPKCKFPLVVKANLRAEAE